MERSWPADVWNFSLGIKELRSPIPVSSISRNTIIECISEESQAPNKLNDVKYAQKSRIEEVEEITVGMALRGEGTVLEDEKSEEAGSKDQEQKDVSVVRGDFMKISSSVLEESSFQS